MSEIVCVVGTLCLLMAAAPMATAASIRAQDLGRSNAVVITGDIDPTDDREFARVVGSLKDPLIFLGSRGGSVIAAINIGKFIRMRGWSTVVAEDQMCASACGLIWLGGVNRFMAPTARIGFHAAYRVEGESQVESGAGNALVGAYLNALGLADRAILYITTPAPTQVRWLSLADARALGITVSTSTFGSAPPNGNGTPAPSLSNTPTLVPKLTPSEQYNFAFSLLRRADYTGAAQALRTFIQLYPNDALAGNAQYWLGETYYVREDFSNAAATFAEGYQKYPRGGKAADGLLKLGMALGQLGQRADACRALARLDRDFPSVPAPIKDRASDEKKRLGC